MKLFAYIINGTSVNQLTTYLVEDLNGNLPYISSTSSSIDGYVDISSIENWDISILLDWSRRRDEILPLFYAESGYQLQNFTGMSIQKKVIGCKYFLLPHSIRTMIVSDDQDYENWKNLLTKTKESREGCIEAMRIKVGQRIRTETLSISATQLFFKDVDLMLGWFIQANLPDFKQWITNEVGSSYENDGFSQKSYYSSTIKDELMSIYNGNY